VQSVLWQSVCMAVRNTGTLSQFICAIVILWLTYLRTCLQVDCVETIKSLFFHHR